ncbi:MAG: DUF948 domain-containing protein [Microcoleus sp. PH2017_03_ELD_O_A]|uniref:DUF948 domain-containing protein n=1 Tax=unclassified Microcoleus TaxID=2642155 RepID=UPI001D33A630|nr:MULTISPECIES: DUF948 domain-containing protein [unclassified Microcoleus]MCC3445430.1 DUF948 domain-containing protein [Microcoleus sp. PH2017_03_ELD_O_A]MCC3471198.1 DUF948 domain-containing protein [Microcoleus sp. PH2017_13_LAR_U_A]MCC3483852.1 DUF948 domain-containing protein [Microcoleus sp. PH2017_14_LAR_D_A]MCC3495940.1 DUF948 domain-containing protein [Microcoleus sp. PH2017_15_JOR_U_A]MCC3595465.1 DUF948 domain-containing protein [Microcoleus sp. PH2017_26_ELK_O_A]
MSDPLFWLGLSILLVAVSLTAVLVTLIPAVQALTRAARSVEKLADTLAREFPPTLEAIRLTGLEISELTDDVSDGVQSAGEVVKQVDRSIGSAKKQAQNVQVTTRSVVTGIKAAWKTLTRKPPISGTNRRSDRLSQSQRSAISLRDSGLDDRYSGGYAAGAGNGESPRLRNGEGSGLPADAEDFEQVRSGDS